MLWDCLLLFRGCEGDGVMCNVSCISNVESVLFFIIIIDI